MKLKIKNKYFRELILSIAYLLIGTLFISVIEYFNFLSSLLIAFLKVTLIVLIITIASYKLIDKTTKKGWKAGLKMSLVFVSLLLIINFLFLNTGINYKIVLYIILIILASVLGSMIGVLKKQELS